MVRKVVFSVALFLALAVIISASPTTQAQCEALEQEVANLEKQVQRLETQVSILLQKQTQLLSQQQQKPNAPATGQTDQKPQAKKAPDARPGYDEALALYDTVEQHLFRGEVDAAKQAVVEFDAQHEGTQAAGWTRALNRELSVVGKPAPDDWFVEEWYQGESEVKLDGNKPTLLIFWESWCPHCRNEVPKLQSIYNEFKDSGLQVLGVTRLTREATEQTVLEFIEQNTVSYPMAKESGALAEYFSVKGIPAAAMVKDGTIVWRGHPTRVTEAFLQNWL
jgi:thiol-disulfide isomerase/thioredoxin